MSNRLHQEIVKSYLIGGAVIDVDMCWEGDTPSEDPGRFYDFYDSKGNCLNEGNPWHDDGKGIPTQAEVECLVASIVKEEA
jgi:hypothetical protein